MAPIARSLRAERLRRKNNRGGEQSASLHHSHVYRGLADEFLELEEAVERSEIIILCAPALMSTAGFCHASSI
ncbi:MAG: hypothetical protein MZV63_33010 [Marinilabiliales bacterium]|nr:hypothetical protein [Marinilabiliales bacterium]